MIGDSIVDIHTARVPVIAGDFGYSERPVAEFGPDLDHQQFRAAAHVGWGSCAEYLTLWC